MQLSRLAHVSINSAPQPVDEPDEADESDADAAKDPATKGTKVTIRQTNGVLSQSPLIAPP